MPADFPLPLDRVQAIVEHLLMDGTRDGLILGDELNRAMGASARRRAEREAEDTDLLRSEDDPHPIIKRVTHVRCGTTFTDPFTIDVMNEQDVACPKCSEVCGANHADCEEGIDCNEPYGDVVWEHRDGTLWLTTSSGGELVFHRPIRTHVDIYKSWVNGPEWWIVPRPNTGDIDGSDNLIVGFDTYEQALAAINGKHGGLRATFAELCTERDGIAWRDRRNPIYQPTVTEGTF